MDATTLKPVRFRFDDSPTYDGFADGSDWNGFDNVKVKPEVRDQIVRDFVRDWIKSGRIGAREDWVSDIDTLPVGDDGLVDLGGGYATQVVDNDDDGTPSDAVASSYPHLDPEPIIDWGPGAVQVGDDWQSADAAVLLQDADSDGDTVAALSIYTQAHRPDGNSWANVDVELTRADCQKLIDRLRTIVAHSRPAAYEDMDLDADPDMDLSDDGVEA